MKYEKIKEAVFLKRPNRFIAEVLVDGEIEKVHVKNTGRCKELLIPNARVFLEEGRGDKRKTKYSLVAVYKGDVLVNMDSQIPNAAAEEGLKKGKIKEIGIPDFIKREKTYGNSRFDIYYEKGEEKGFIEVKGVTLEYNKKAMFPDAPTERGRKHIYELIKAKKEGYKTWILFLVQMKGAESFSPNWETDKAFSEALMEAEKEEVGILVYDCIVTENSIELDKKI